MSNTSNNLQTKKSSALHNAIMEVGNDGTPQQPRAKEKETYATVSEETHKWINVEAEVVQIILIVIDNDIYSTVDACPNAMETWNVTPPNWVAAE
ncbi:hypothetical protein Tco_0393333 [Tanacetum coccineum]|uniref:Uncharacterized protein n=1 Tax=Tanacetum coccineum TaxID=301880 RepID=A0ABQ5DFJ8_9ASTR